MSHYSSQLAQEQRMVDRAYHRLDELRAQTRRRLDAVRAAGSHGSPTQRTERDSFAAMYEDRLTQLRAVEDRLVFGRIDNARGEHRYIGRIGLSGADHEPMLTDWRAEAARPFYEATPSDHGDIVMRRHITLSFRKVTALEDEVLDIHSSRVGEASTSGTLTGEGALLASLNTRRTGKMTDIVATIQAEQDRIIRAPMNRAVVVQGGPGTGKTAVALHRAAYLLYTHRRQLQHAGVLVVGPSMAFLHYIDQVLPSLGETGVVSRTIGDLIPGIVVTGVDSPRAALLKGDARMAKVVAAAVALRERIPRSLPTVRINGIAVPMLAEDVRQELAAARRARRPHNGAREDFVRGMLQAMTQRYVEQLDYTPEPAELARVTSLLRMNDKVRVTLNLAWLPMSATWLIQDLWAKPDRLRNLAPWLSDDDVAALTRAKRSPLTRSDVPLLDEAMDMLGPDPREYDARAARQRAQASEEEQFARDTLAQAGIGSGIVTSRMLAENMRGDDPELTAQRAAGDREWTYGHVVVDEAQELTAMDWRMLLRRCPSRSFTIVGDVAQTDALGGSRSWQRTLDPLFGPEGWDLNELTINYRNPREVSHKATQFAAAQGLYVSTQHAVRALPDAVHVVVTANDERDLLEHVASLSAQMVQDFAEPDGSGRVAVLTAGDRLAAVRARLDKLLGERLGASFAERLRAQDALDRQLIVGTIQEVKGLEYDAVIMVQPARIALSAPSRLVAASDLYVAMTRPTQRLVIVRTDSDAADLPL